MRIIGYRLARSQKDRGQESAQTVVRTYYSSENGMSGGVANIALAVTSILLIDFDFGAVLLESATNTHPLVVAALSSKDPGSTTPNQSLGITLSSPSDCTKHTRGPRVSGHPRSSSTRRTWSFGRASPFSNAARDQPIPIWFSSSSWCDAARSLPFRSAGTPSKPPGLQRRTYYLRLPLRHPPPSRSSTYLSGHRQRLSPPPLDSAIGLPVCHL